jgi:transcriptional regulator with XRE-family HTH domain
MAPIEKLAVKLKALRERRGLSQEQLAEAAGISRPHLARLETAKQDPTLSTIEKLAKALKVKAADLLKEERRDAMVTAVKEYDLRRGHIELVDRGTGDMRCRECGGVWRANIKPNSRGRYYRGAWTCPHCGANSRGGYSEKA